jgi:NitT/TauT family transport system permease protein
VPDHLRRWGLIVLAHAALVGVWQLVVLLADVPKFVLPSPWQTLQSLAEPSYQWAHNTMITAAEVFGGYFIAVCVGVGLALLFTWSKPVDEAFSPLLISLNMIPKVALGPIFIVWFKYGVGPNILIAFSICFLPILLTMQRGLREVEPDLIDLVRALKGSKWQIFLKIQLPGSLPYLFSGMKVAAVLAVAGAIVGEFIASERGLGYLMLQVQVTLDTPAMFMAVLLITLVGVALYALVLLLERLVVVRDARLS